MADLANPPDKITSQGLLAVILSYLGYATLYIIRKPLSTSKPYISQDLKICSKLKLSIVDNSHLIPYSLVAILFPNFVDKFGGKLSLRSYFFGGRRARAGARFF